MSLLTNFQSVQDKIDKAEKWTNYILQHKLPYTPVEYIKGSNSPYIDSLIICNSNLKIQVKFSLSKHTGDCYIGYNPGGESDSFRFFTANSIWYLDYGSGEGRNRITGGSASLNTIYNIEFGNRYIKNLDTGLNIISSSTVSSFTKSYTCRLSTDSDAVTFYYCKIYNGATLVRDFIPVKDSNNVVCMYDKISKTYFYNVGPGSFTPGPEVN